MLYLTQYRYDEAGNRVRKVRYKYTGSTPDPEFDLSGDAPPWTMQSDEFYVRDVSGKEIALYSGSSLTQWNIWGLDNVGKINADTTRNYYLKDHLGSIRVVLNSTNTVISAQDYDCWGYVLENRSYNASAMKYDFTGKERDDETSYDYFGARYYDSRIGRWGQVEPLLDIYLSFSPYIYIFDNPTNIVDVDGRGPGGDDIQPGQQIETVEPGGDMDDIGPKGRPIGNINLSLTSRSSANTNARLSLKSSSNTENITNEPSKQTQKFTWNIKSIKGKANELGLNKFHGKEATKENVEQIGKILHNFMKGEPYSLKYNVEQGRVKFGNIKLPGGKEVRIGKDEIHPYQHIDVNRNEPGKKFKNLQLKIETIPFF